MKSKSAFRLVRTGSTAACLLAAALAALLAAPPARAAIRTWDNANADLLWTNEINWDGTSPGNGLPGTADTATFGTASTQPGFGNIDLGATSHTISTLTVNYWGYNFTNGTLSLNTINQSFDGRTTQGTSPKPTVNSPLLITAAVTDADGNGLTLNQYSSDSAGLTISGPIAITNTSSTALRVVGTTARAGAWTLGSIASPNSVAGGVSLEAYLNNGTIFQGAWTISGDLNLAKSTGQANNVSGAYLKGAIAIGGNLICSQNAANATGSINIFAGSSVGVAGDLKLQSPIANSTPVITVNQALTSLGGSVRVYSGILALNVTDPIPSTTQAFLLGDHTATSIRNAQISINTNARTLNNPVTVQSGNSFEAILASGATGTGSTNKVTYAGAITLNKPLSINASNTAGAILDVTGQITGAQPIAINATGALAGTVTLSNATNSYSGGTTVCSGLLQSNVLGALGGSGRNVTIYSPGALAFGSSFVDTNIPTALARVATASTGAIAADNYGTTDLNFDTAGLTAASLGAAGSVTYTGTLTPNGTTYRLGGGGGTLTFTPAAYTSGNDLVINGNGLTGTVDFGGQTKTFGAITVAGGTLKNGTLNCTSYSLLGGTVTATLNNGTGSSALTKTGSGTLTFGGTTAQSFTGGLIVNAGTVAENFANFPAVPNDNLLDPTNVLTLGGGTLSLTGKSNVASSQTFASTTLSANSSSTITLAKTGTGTMTIGLGAITRNTGSILRFSAAPDASTILASTSTANTNDILGSWAVVGAGGTGATALQYATVSGGQIIRYPDASATVATPADLSNMTGATTNYSLAKPTGGTTLTGPVTASTLRVTSTSDNPIANNGKSITLNSLIGVGTNRTIISGAGNLVIGDTKELVIHWTVGFSAITCPIVDNPAGDSSVVINIPQTGEFNFTGTNTYKGGTTINAVEQLNFNANSFGSGPVTVNGGVRFRHFGGTLANALTLNGTILHSGGTYSGPITLATASSAAGTAGTITGDMSGPGGFTVSVSAGNVQTFSGTNSYTGPTSITSGTAMFAKAASLYNAVEANWTPANITVNSGTALRLAVGGTNEFTGAQVGTLVTNLTTGVNNNGLKAGSILYLDPRNAGGTPVTIAANITDSTGPGGGQVNLTVGQTDGSDPNQTVVLSGANTYSGKTTLDRYKNTTLSVSSFNSVSSPMANSSLGRPTTVADGTINFGNSDTSTGVLLYTGTGEITDRILNSASNTGHITLDQSGSNLLKFTGGITGGNSSRILTLQGSSTTGTGEIAGAITQGTVTKTGSGTWTLSATNTYTGATSINNGTLKLSAGSLANTAIAVTSTGTLAVQPGSATAISAGNTGTAAAGASLNLGGRIFDMTDGFASAFNLVQGSSFASNALTVTNGATFKMNLSDAAADLLAVTKAAAVSGTVNVTIDTSGATSLTPGTYNLITAASGLAGGTWQFTGGGTTQEITIGANTYELTLAASATAVSVTVAGSSSPYDTWANGTFSPALTAKLPGDNQDVDSLNNLQEFAFGTLPTVATGDIVVSGTSLTPGAPKIVSENGNYYIVYGRRKDYVTAGLTYTVEFTAGLDLWGDNDDINNPPVPMGATDETIDAMRVLFPPTIHVANGDPKPNFARVRVVLAP
jgi:fibronectin-binding autotransporter adhesin